MFFVLRGERTRLARLADVAALVAASGLVPWPLLQAAFHFIQPTAAARKLVRFLDRQRDPDFVEGFGALERWGNDNVSLPGAFFERYIAALYRDDALVRGAFRLGGRPVDLAAIRCPVCVVSFADDDPIVPAASAAVMVPPRH